MRRLLVFVLSAAFASLLASAGCSMIVERKDGHGGSDADTDVDSDADTDGTPATDVGIPSAAGLVTSASYRCKVVVGGASVVGYATGANYRVAVGAGASVGR